jgi:hypothetical protein
LAVVAAALVLCEAHGALAASVAIGGVDAAPGETASVTVRLRSMGDAVVAAQNTIQLGPPLSIVGRADGEPDCEANQQIDKDATTFRFHPPGCIPGAGCTSVRAVVIAFDNLMPILDGSVLYTCRLAVAAGAAPGDYPLRNTEVGAADANGQSLAVDAVDGVVRVRARQVSIDLSGGSATAGGELALTAVLDAEGETVVGTQNRIDFAAPLAIASHPEGTPECEVNPAIDKDASAFDFLPRGCHAGVDCTAVSALILAFDNVDPIPSGTTLYTCRVTVAAEAAPGLYLLANSELGAAGPSGELLAATGDDAEVEVGSDDDASVGITVASVFAGAGQRIAVPVRLDVLDPSGAGVAGTQNDIGFDPQTAIAGTAEATPDCTVDSAIDKNGTTFQFLPNDCTPAVDCTGVRAFVLSLDNVDPIPDGAALYECAVQVDADAEPGTHVLRNRNAAAADAAGADLATAAHDGAVTVVCAGDCNGDGLVGISELLRGVNISLANSALDSCPLFDLDRSGDVAISEIILAVGSALAGCSSDS